MFEIGLENKIIIQTITYGLLERDIRRELPQILGYLPLEPLEPAISLSLEENENVPL